MKEVRINIPEGYEIDEQNSTFECIKFKPKELTYKDIQDKICHVGRDTIGWPEDEENFEKVTGLVIRPSTCPTLKQMKRLTAINQLMNVAYYFNEIVDKNINSKYRVLIYIDNDGNLEHTYVPKVSGDCGIVTFKTMKSAEKAIKVLGEETVKLAISLQDE